MRSKGKNHVAERLVVGAKLEDGYYQARVTLVASDGSSDGASEREVYVELKNGNVTELSANEWFEQSLANQALN